MTSNPVELSRRKILIVEDEPDMREILREVFEEEGWRVTTAFSVASAAALLSRTDWSCILLDLHLSDGSADELDEQLKPLRSVEPALRPTVILMTGVPETREQGRLHGTIDATLLKPFAIADLLALVSPAQAVSRAR